MKINFTGYIHVSCFLTVILLSGFSKHTFSQSNNDELLNTDVVGNVDSEFADTSKVESTEKKNYWIPAAQGIGLNLTLAAFNAYVLNEDYAKISWKTIGNNLKNGFVWDEDHFLMNQFLHPYHGAAYYNAARFNGLSYWQATSYVFGGSLMWELFMENEAPSINDLITTSYSGVTLGEISYHVSNLIIDESSIGLERVAREFFSTVINPMQGLTRLVKGDMWKSGEPNQTPDYKLFLSTGVRRVFLGKDIDDGISYLSLRADFNYGDRFDADKNTKPFDYFSLNTELNITKGNDIATIFATGAITDSKIKLFKHTENVIGLYQDMDLLSNVVYKLTAASLTGQLTSRISLSNSLTMENHISTSAILMGGTDSPYEVEEGKNYNLGPGASGSLGTKITIEDFGDIYTGFKRFWIHTLSGAKGDEFVGFFSIGVNYQLFENSFLGLDYFLYERHSYYKNYPETQGANSALRIYFKQKI